MTDSSSFIWMDVFIGGLRNCPAFPSAKLCVFGVQKGSLLDVIHCVKIKKTTWI